MILWQFTVIVAIVVIAVLIGILLIYARTLAERIACANAALKRIEEALLAMDRTRGRALATAAETTPAAEVYAKNGGASYLTVRDLKVITRAAPAISESADAVNPEIKGTTLIASEPQSSARSGVVSEDSVTASSESHGALSASGESQSPPDSSVVSEDPVAASSESRDALSTTDELPGSPDSSVVSEDPVETNSASRDALSTSDELPSSPVGSAADRDLIEKRKRNEQLFLSSQRRRRRARSGY